MLCLLRFDACSAMRREEEVLLAVRMLDFLMSCAAMFAHDD